MGLVATIDDDVVLDEEGKPYEVIGSCSAEQAAAMLGEREAAYQEIADETDRKLEAHAALQESIKKQSAEMTDEEKAEAAAAFSGNEQQDTGWRCGVEDCDFGADGTRTQTSVLAHCRRTGHPKDSVRRVE